MVSNNIIKNAAARLTWPECKQRYIHLYVNIQMYIYLLTFPVRYEYRTAALQKRDYFILS